jgi:hypothetical protein
MKNVRKTYRRKTSCRKSGKRKQRSMKIRGGEPEPVFWD